MRIHSAISHPLASGFESVIGPVFRLSRAPTGRIEAPFLHPGSYSFLVAAHGYKSVRVGVRVRTQWQEDQIRENLRNVEGVPGDLTTRIRLARLKED